MLDFITKAFGFIIILILCLSAIGMISHFSGIVDFDEKDKKQALSECEYDWLKLSTTNNYLSFKMSAPSETLFIGEYDDNKKQLIEACMKSKGYPRNYEPFGKPNTESTQKANDLCFYISADYCFGENPVTKSKKFFEVLLLSPIIGIGTVIIPLVGFWEFIKG